MPTECDVLHSLQFSTASNEEPYMKYYEPKKGDVIIDAGAHVGIYTRKFSEAVGRDGLVIAIEPDYRALGLLTLNTEDLQRKYHNILILPYALWNIDTVIQFYLFKGNLGMSSCLFKHFDDRDETYPIRAKKLDTIVEDNLGIDPDTSLRRINFIKMDIEASEIRALEGMKETLNKTNALAIAAYHRIAPELDSSRTFPHVQKKLKDAGFKTKVEIGHDGEIVYAN